MSNSNSYKAVLDPRSGFLTGSPDGIDSISQDMLSSKGIISSSKASSYNRPPSPADNASKGYTINSLWQYAGSIYQPTATPDNTACAWQQLQPTGALPVDVLGASAICAGGLMAMKAGFTGPAITLTATVSASPVSTDINILSGGVLDTDAVRKVFNSADTGTYVYVTKVYDQTGNGKHLNYTAISGKVTRGMYIIWDTLMCQYVLATDQNYRPEGQALSFDATMSVAETSMSAFFFGRGVGSQAAPNSQVVASFGTGVTALSIHTGETAAGPTIAAWNGSPRTPINANCTPVDCKPCVVSMVGGASNTTLRVNEDSCTIGGGNATARTGGLLGHWDLAAGKFAAMRYVGFAISNINASTAQQAKIHQWFYTKFDVKPQARDRVIFIGDSRGTLVNSSNCESTGQFSANIGVQLAERLESDCVVVNCSTSGAPNSYHVTHSIPGLVAIYRPGVKNIAVFLMGVNDFLVDVLTPTQSLAALNSNISALKVAGYYTIAISELRCTTSTNNTNTYTDTLHAMINAGQSLADEVIDMWDMTPIITPLAGVSPFYYPDGLHPGAAISGMIASKIAKTVDINLSK